MTTPISTARPRTGLFMWITWMAKLISGDSNCEWAVQFMSNWEGYAQVPSGFDAAAWQIEHNALLLRRKQELEILGAVVFTEGQNHFRLRGRTGTLAGKADLVVFPDPDDYGKGIVEDTKTGKPQPAHAAQVLLYMMALPWAFPEYKDAVFAGRVVYQGHVVDIPADRLDEAFIEKFKQTWARMANVKPAQKVPSPQECSFCKLSEADCPERIEGSEIPEGVTDLF